MVSSAQIIEAVQLAISLANIHNSKIPTLKDMQDAAITCMAQGSHSEINLSYGKYRSLERRLENTTGLYTNFYTSDFYSILKRIET